MWLKVLSIAIGVVIAGLVAAVLISRSRLDRANARLVAELLAIASPESDRVFRNDDLARLPELVQRYLANVLTEGQPYVRTVRLQQNGEFRLGDGMAPWKPLSATQHLTIDPPGFVWDARVEIVPLFPVRVVDMYKAGKGARRGRILSSVPVTNAEPSPELNSGELMRYLAETVWFPTALLPGEGVDWVPVDEQSARATMEHRGTTASLVFHFNSQNEVERVLAGNRSREVGGAFEPTPWTGHFSNYQVRNGMLIPIDGEMEWNLPGGDLSYWRGHLAEIEHEPE
jgi:hypothetical protein